MTTIDADVLVIGAGPAGSAAALCLSRQGARVLLVDRAPGFPRDKVCGDALIPDALAILDELALGRLVRGHARCLRGVDVYAPNQRVVTIGGDCACVPRPRFDALLRQAAVDAGARAESGWRVERPIRADGDRGAVVGALFSTDAGPRVVRAGMTLLATGAAVEPLQRFSVCERPTASASAARIYVQVDPGLARDADHLCISYDRSICPGYGWVFPGPDNIFNVGIGAFHDSRGRPLHINLRHLLQRFVEQFPRAAAVMRHGRVLTPLKGAPLRTTLAGARLSAPGLLVVGEAVGTTYAFSGEGIGKAMASGVLAAESLAAAGGGPEAAGLYEHAMRTQFQERFVAYKRAQQWLSRPLVANMLAWRARRSRFVRRQLDGLFQETVSPRELFSLSGLVRTLVS